MPFDVNKYHILQVGTQKQKTDYKMNGVKIERGQCVKTLGVTIVLNFKFSQQCKAAEGKAKFHKQKFLLQK